MYQQFNIKDYIGEFVIESSEWKNNQRQHTKKFIPATVDTSKFKDHAIVLGNGISRLAVPAFSIAARLKRIPHPKTLAAGKWITYSTWACNAGYRDIEADNLVITRGPMLSKYVKDCADKSTQVWITRFLLGYNTGKNLVPYHPAVNSGALAAYLAAVSGHKKVYLLGFDNFYSGDYNNVYADTYGYDEKKSGPQDHSSWVENMNNLFIDFPNTEFIHVCPAEGSPAPEPWKYNLNYTQISHWQFRQIVDI